ncbi:thermonuclease family protein [Actinomadura scrupuli]|uniref:thermonuclease family protein n=1 Tax=Actinomadura scrupuli TaxID=559629 RepID=UPI003D954A07
MVDGDTLVTRMAGQRLRVRLIGVDAPEIRHRGSVLPGECFGTAATAALRRLAPPGSVLKVTPDRRRRDPYGRELRYAWTSGGLFVNEALIRGGYARAMAVPPNDRFIGLFRAAESAAHQARSGLWSACRWPAGDVDRPNRQIGRWEVGAGRVPSQADPPRITANDALRSTRLAGTPSGWVSPDVPG